MKVQLLCEDIVDGLAVQRNHRVVVVGGTFNCSQNGRFHPAIVRLTPRGVLDPSFGDGGTIITTGTGFAAGVAIQHLGSDRIVVAGGPGPNAPTGRAPFLAERYRAF